MGRGDRLLHCVIWAPEDFETAASDSPVAAGRLAGSSCWIVEGRPVSALEPGAELDCFNASPADHRGPRLTSA